MTSYQRLPHFTLSSNDDRRRTIEVGNEVIALFQTVEGCNLTSTEVWKGNFRLDAAFYSSERKAAEQTLIEAGFPTQRLDGIADVHCSGVRQRSFVDPEHGIALLTGSDLQTTTDMDLKWMSRFFTRNIAFETLHTGDILLSSAGTVG